MRIDVTAPASAALMAVDLRTMRTALLVDFLENVGPEFDWAPDGSALVYSAAPANGPSEIWVVPSGGGPARQLVHPSYDQQASSPTFSPDGSWLAFILRGNGPERVMRIHPDGSGARSVVESPFPAVAGLDWGPAVIEIDAQLSPSGSTPR